MASLTLDQLLNFQEPSIDFAPIRDSLMQASGRNRARADSFYSDYEATYKPLMQKLASEASAAGSPAGLEDAARTAVASAAKQGKIQREATDRRLASLGVNPNAGRFATAQVGAGLSDASARVGAANTARQAKRAEGLNLLTSTAGMGMGLVSAGNASESQATNIDQNLANTALGVYQTGLSSRMLAASALGRQQAAGGGGGVPISGGTVFKDNINAPFGTYSPGGGGFGLDSLYPSNRWTANLPG